MKKRKCKICKSEFKPISIVNVYCSLSCKKKGDTQKASKKPKIKICKFCENEFEPYTSLSKFCTIECRIKHIKKNRTTNWIPEKAKGITGKNNPAYRNGYYTRKNSKNINHIGVKKYLSIGKEIKNKMLKDEGYVYCQRCNTSTALIYETHHIIFRSEKPNHENLHDEINLILLCVKCHNEVHKHKKLRRQWVKDRKLAEVFGNDILLYS